MIVSHCVGVTDTSFSMSTYFRTYTLATNAIFILFFFTAVVNFNFGITATILLLIALRYYRIQQLELNSVYDRLGLESGADNSLQLSPIFHRGGDYRYPENTLEAIKEAKQNGAQGVEVDMAFTSDGIGILFHDLTVDRTTGEHGYISEMTYEEISRLDAAATHQCRETSGPVKIPTLEECLTTCLEEDLTVYIDCKSKPEKTAILLCDLFKKNPQLYSKAIVCSFFPLIIYAVRKKDPHIMTGLTLRHNALQFLNKKMSNETNWWKTLLAPLLDVLLEWSHYAWIWYLCGNSFTLICKDDLSRETCIFWKKLGIILIPWTVNEQLEREYFQKSLLCPIITDSIV